MVSLVVEPIAEARSRLPSSECLAFVVTELHLLEPVALGAKVFDFVEHPVKQRFG
jgi:hypothetical protein